MADHPAGSSNIPHDEHEHDVSETPSLSSFHRCRPGRRCGVCRLLTGQQRRERALFKMVLSQDGDFLSELERLAGLFHDSAAAA